MASSQISHSIAMGSESKDKSVFRESPSSRKPEAGKTCDLGKFEQPLLE